MSHSGLATPASPFLSTTLPSCHSRWSKRRPRFHRRTVRRAPAPASPQARSALVTIHFVHIFESLGGTEVLFDDCNGIRNRLKR